MGSGRLESVTEKNIYTDITIQYKYDSNGQLLSASYSDGRQYHYQYDMFGNRTQVSYPDKTPVKSVYSCGLITKFNQDSVKNDALGNNAAIGSEHFKFNHHNFLKEDNLFHYDYNALGLRTRVKNNKNEQTQLFHMIDDLPYIFATQGKERVYYFWADGQCLGQSSNKTGVQYFFEDHFGSIRCVINQNGDIVGYAEYTPFGIPVQRIDNIRFGYAGEEQDVSGKLYLRSRYYMPSIGRFISRDPHPYNFTSSLKWNWYTYVGNSPVNFKDPDGCYAKDNRKSSMEEAEYKTYRFFRYAASSIGNVSDNKNQNAIYNMSRFTPITGAGTVAIMPSMTPIASKLVNQLNEPVYRKSIYGAALATELIGKIPMPYNYIPDIASQVLYTYHDTYRVQHHQISKEEYVHNIVERVLGNLAPDLPSSSKNSSFMNRVTDDIPKTMLHYLNSPHMNKINNIINMAPVDNKYTSSLVMHPELIERIAVNAFRSFQTPNVGGVYLDKATKFIGKLSDIQGVVYDPSSNRIILVGEDGSNLSLPEFRMDHLAAAFRTVYGNYTLEPGVTIDPNPENPKSEKMIVRFFGGMENTHFGHILFEADRQMKGLSLGIDNISKEKQGVSGYYNLLTLSLSKNKNHYSKELWSRFWLVPEKIVARKSDDGKSILFSDVKIRIKTETMRWENGKLVSAGDLKDEHAEYFAQHFSKYYDEYAKEYPIYNDLKQLAKIVAIVKWIKEEGFPIDMNWLEQYDLFYKTPETTPALTVSDKKETQNSNMINIQNVSIFGGTDLTVFPEYLKTHNLSDSFSKKIIHSIHNKPDK